MYSELLVQCTVQTVLSLVELTHQQMHFY